MISVISRSQKKKSISIEKKGFQLNFLVSQDVN